MRAIGATVVCALVLYVVDGLYNGGAYTAALHQLILNVETRFR
jgi:hypothetical protein